MGLCVCVCVQVATQAIELPKGSSLCKSLSARSITSRMLRDLIQLFIYLPVRFARLGGGPKSELWQRGIVFSVAAIKRAPRQKRLAIERLRSPPGKVKPLAIVQTMFTSSPTSSISRSHLSAPYMLALCLLSNINLTISLN